MTIKPLIFDFSVCKVIDYSQVDLSADYTFIGKTERENSLLCPTESVPENTVEREDGWRGFYIDGILDFSLIGILADVSAVLAAKKIGIFVVSTYNTDYVFVKKENFAGALEALQNAGYSIQP